MSDAAAHVAIKTVNDPLLVLAPFLKYNNVAEQQLSIVLVTIVKEKLKICQHSCILFSGIKI